MPCFPFNTMPNTKYSRDKTFMVKSACGHSWKKFHSIDLYKLYYFKDSLQKKHSQKRNKLQNCISFVLQTFCTDSMRYLIIRSPISFKYFKIQCTAKSLTFDLTMSIQVHGFQYIVIVVCIL